MAPDLDDRADASPPSLSEDERPDFPTTGIDATKLTLTGIEPASGPFSGGTPSVLRGSGFGDDALVRIGGALVQPGDTMVLSHNRISVVVPAGIVGDADVEVTQGDDTVKLDAAFNYNALQLTPAEGSISGGTLIELTAGGATFDDGVIIEFGGEPCADVTQLAPARIRCKAPRHVLGRVDVIARWADEVHPQLIARSAYEYVETLDAEMGGLSGEAIHGTLNVAVMNDLGFVIPKALVVVGNDLRNTRYRGLTDERGSIVFSGGDLKGPVTVHASAKCYQKGSIVSFDAENATIILSAAFDLSCQSGGEGPARRGALGALISGELIFPGVDEFGVNDWSIVPKPRASEIRVAYVFTTRSGSDTRNPAPDPQGTMARLVETTAEVGQRGFKYKIFARPAGLAVYALCGIERTDNQEFTPYVMGLARNVVTAPGEENENVNLDMDISLDRELAVSLRDYPAPSPTGPSEFRVRASVDLGGEGVIVREVGTKQYDVVRRRVGSDTFRFFGQPPFARVLQGASYELVAGYYTPDTDVPLTTQRRTGVPQSQSDIEITGFLGIPRALSPATGGMLPTDRTLRFELEGEAADLIIVDIADGTGFPVWSEILPGDARNVPVPDFSMIDGQADFAAGFLNWTVTAVKIDEFQYNQFRYAQLAPRYFTHTAINVLTARR